MICQVITLNLLGRKTTNKLTKLTFLVTLLGITRIQLGLYFVYDYCQNDMTELGVGALLPCAI